MDMHRQQRRPQPWWCWSQPNQRTNDLKKVAHSSSDLIKERNGGSVGTATHEGGDSERGVPLPTSRGLCERNVRTLFLIFFRLRFWFFFSVLVFIVVALSIFKTRLEFWLYGFWILFVGLFFPSCCIELTNGGLVPISEALKVCFIVQWFCFFFYFLIF